MATHKTTELARHRKERMWMWVQLVPVMAILSILFGGAACPGCYAITWLRALVRGEHLS